LGAEVVAMVVAEDELVGAVLDEQLALTSARHTASPAMQALRPNWAITGAAVASPEDRERREGARFVLGRAGATDADTSDDNPFGRDRDAAAEDDESSATVGMYAE
jgi:hypothetical protein